MTAPGARRVPEGVTPAYPAVRGRRSAVWGSPAGAGAALPSGIAAGLPGWRGELAPRPGNAGAGVRPPSRPLLCRLWRTWGGRGWVGGKEGGRQWLPGGSHSLFTERHVIISPLACTRRSHLPQVLSDLRVEEETHGI